MFASVNPDLLQCLDLLAASFDCSTNKLGYKILPDYLRILQGDGISYLSIGEAI